MKMQTGQFKEMLKTKPDIFELADQCINNPDQITMLFDIINTEKSSIKFTCEKTIRIISDIEPSALYPYFDRLVSLLDSDNNFILWGAIISISDVVCVDIDNKFEKIYEKYFSYLSSPTMITAANVVQNAYKIIWSKPGLEKDITKKLLNIENYTYYIKGEVSEECKNILFGHMLDCFDKYFETSAMKMEIVEFARKQVHNNRDSTAKKAEKFLKKHNKI
ncbi:MAG: hypothetical protein GYA50_08530 [Eubacteriaceae bacterium]|nr:hypothetical protein [Eubacteriaceae bacterium]